MSTEKKMFEKITDFMQVKKGVSFAELEILFEENGFDYKGDLMISDNALGKNVFMWGGWNDAAIEVWQLLSSSGRVQFETCAPLIYLIDGKTLNIEIAKKPTRDYKSIRWVPVTLDWVGV